jgi:hypothetical protein
MRVESSDEVPLQPMPLMPSTSGCSIAGMSGKIAAVIAVACAALAAQAQGTPPTGSTVFLVRPAPPVAVDPLDPQARVPAASYTSPLSTYRRLGEDKPVPWKQANETVNRIGGWRTYTREAQQPDPPAPARPASAPHRH